MTTKATYKISKAASDTNEKNISFMPNTSLDILETCKNDRPHAKAITACAKTIIYLYSMFLSHELYIKVPTNAVQYAINAKSAIVRLLNSKTVIIQ